MTFLVSPHAIALASRSKSVPVVVRVSQPKPTATAVKLGACFVNETLPPLLRLTLIPAAFRRCGVQNWSPCKYRSRANRNTLSASGGDFERICADGRIAKWPVGG